VIDRSAFLSRIDDVDSGFPEVFGVARGQRRAACTADGGDLRVEAVYGEAEAIGSLRATIVAYQTAASTS